MISVIDIELLLKAFGFSLEEGSAGVWLKNYSNHENYKIKVHVNEQKIDYGKKIVLGDKSTCNFKAKENFVVLECVNRLLEKGYSPKNITLEKTFPTGHGTSGKLDILVNHDNGVPYLMIECKTYGVEFDKALKRILKDGGQLFTYFQQDKKADVLVLYASQLEKKGKIQYQNEIINIEEDYRQTGNVKDFYDRWNKLPKNNGVFDNWVRIYAFESKALTRKNLKEIKQEDSSFIFNQFLEILRHNVVSDKPNAFNKIFTLFLCKIYDEKSTNESDELAFQWFYTPYQYEGISYLPDNNISFQKRLTDLYKKGMKEFLDKEVTDISDADFERKYGSISKEYRQQLLDDIVEIRLKKNNEFAIKEVFNDDSFVENAKVVKEVVELLQGYKIRYTKKQQYLSDFFEMLLTTGLKQESGQFFTPVPIAQFIIKSIPLDKIVKEKLSKGEKDNLLPTIIDYAAGSGHFITESMHEMQRIINETDPKDYISDTAKKIKSWKEDHFDWAIKYVYGIEKDYRLVKVGKVGCYLHGDGLAQIIHSDGLGNFSNTKEYKELLQKTPNKEDARENKQFDIVVSNPPYSVSAFKNNARKYYTEDDFELYKNLTDQSSEIECLFIERTKQLLKDGGIAGIILPSSILSNTGIYTKAREIILQYFEIVAIAELGSNTFMATGTNTVTLFMRRRNNYVSKNIRSAVETAILHKRDVTINQIAKPISKYVKHVWEEITYSDYISLLQSDPNQAIEKHEIYKEYRKKIKARNEKEFWNSVIKMEQEKIFYFILTYPQKVVLVNSGEKNDEKQFLGYEFSNRRGNEGIHPIQRGKSIDECTQLFDPEIFDNPLKASTYIYQAFQGDFDSGIHDSLKKNITRINLVDMLTFDRVDFEKNISLAGKKKVKIESRWEQVKLENLSLLLVRGKSAQYGVSNIQIIKSGQARGIKNFDFSEKHFVDNKFVLDERRLQKGDLLINSSGVGTAGRVTLFCLDGTFVVDSHITILRPDTSLVLPEFILYCLAMIGFKNIEALAMGQSGQIELSLPTIQNIKIPLPPKAVQERIVEEIKILEEKEIEEIKNTLDLQYKIRSILQEGKRIENYKFSDIATLEYGKPLHSNLRIAGEYPVMGSNGVDGTHNKYLIKGPSIIIGRKGSAGKINYVEKNCYPIDTTFYVNHKNDKIILKYLYYFLQELDLEALAKGKGVGVPGLNRNNVHALKISIHSMIEQQKIISQIELIESEIVGLEKNISAISHQKELVMKKYL